MKRNMLLIFIVVLALALYLVPEQKVENISNLDQAESHLISSSCLGSVERVKFIHAGNSQELVLSDSLNSDDLLVRRSKWLLKEPFFAPADDEKVVLLLKAIQELKGSVDKTSPKSNKQNEVGLTPPEGVLILQCGSVQEVLSLGTKSEISKNRYFQKEGEEFLYLVEGDFFESLVSILSDIRAKKILAFQHSDIQGLEVVESDKYFSLEKLESGEWLISTEGRKFKGDSKFIEKKLKDLVGMSISRRFDNPLEVLPFTGLEQPRLIINLKIRIKEETKNHELVLQFGRGILGELLAKKQENTVNPGKESYYLKITKDNPIYELEKSYIADWLQGANHFRQRNPFESVTSKDIKSASLKVDNLSCGLDHSNFSDNPQMQAQLDKALREFYFDTFLSSEELTAYPASANLSAQFQLNSGIVSVSKIKDVVSAIESKEDKVASIWEVSEIGKDSYYGSMLVDRVSIVQEIFKDLCLRGKSSERHS